MPIDFESEGLLEGLEGDDREARRELLEELAADGVPIEELRDAVQAGRLALLPVERALEGSGPRYTPLEVAEKAGLAIEYLERYFAALGISIPARESRTRTESDLEAAKRIRAFQEVGLPEDGMLQVARTMGMATARIAAANRELIGRTLMRPGDTERDLALRFAAAARTLMPLVGPALAYALQIHLLEQVRRDVIAQANLDAGEFGGATDVGVCFLDMVGFTRLGESVGVEELGLVAGRLEEMAVAVAEPPVRVVKLIGDAAMLVSEEPVPLLEAALELIDAAQEEGDEFPQLRAGSAFGPAVPRSGDWYGSTVNRASRITGKARPASLLVDAPSKDAAGERFHYSFAGQFRLKGVGERVPLFRTRREPVERG